MSNAPRTEAELRGLLAAIDTEAKAIDARKAKHAEVRQPIEDALPGAEHALAYGLSWKPPTWWGKDSRHPDPKAVAGAVAKLRGALAALGAGGDHPLIQKLGGDDFRPISTSDSQRIEQRLEELAAEREELEAELERRLAGPGERRPYRMTHGSLGRFEDGKQRIYRAGAVLELTSWEADARFVPVDSQVST